MTHNREDCWPRLESVIKWSNMSTNHFARHIGLMRGENLYQIKRGNNGISRRLAEMIVSTFPEINMIWLLTGVGEMVKERDGVNTQIDYYGVDVEHDIRRVEILEATSRLMLPKGIDAEFAIDYRGGAMNPSIPTNSVVILKRVSPEMIIPGTEYLVVTSNIVALRSVRQFNAKSPNGVLRLIAHQSRIYDDILIEEGEIEQLYRVVAKLIINN
ncbi:MAG: hypothetical protein SNH55_04840 [Rikenellaceae bacterium]